MKSTILASLLLSAFVMGPAAAEVNKQDVKPGRLASLQAERVIDFQNQLEAAKDQEIFYLNESVVRLQTTMIVPPEPSAEGTMFVWPGLQSLPYAENWEPIGNGVLQPVLTWGPTCAPTPNEKPPSHSTWWISGQYVNTNVDEVTPPEYKGCHSGEYITANPGDYLFIDMSLDQNTNTWTQTITNQMTNAQTDYSFNLAGQSQMMVDFVIEPYDGVKMISPATFLHTKITYAKPSDCGGVSSNGMVSPVVSMDGGLSCFIDSIVLKQK